MRKLSRQLSHQSFHNLKKFCLHYSAPSSDIHETPPQWRLPVASSVPSVVTMLQTSIKLPLTPVYFALYAIRTH